MKLKRSFLKAAQRTGLFAAARRATARQLRILAYHGLWITPGYEYGDCSFMGVDQFEARMRRLKRSGLPIIALDEAVEGLKDGTLPDAAVVITIDDGWETTLTHMLPILETYQLPATLYATTWYAGRELPVVNVAVDYLGAAAGLPDIDRRAKVAEIDALPVGDRLEALRRFGAGLGVDEAWLELRQFHLMSAEALAAAARRGLDIQLHTHRHIDVNERIDDLPGELAENRAFLSRAVPAARFDHFCYPSGTRHPRAPALLAANGVRSGTLDDRGLNAPGTDPFLLRRLLDARRIPEVEFDAYLYGALHFIDAGRTLLHRASRHGPAERGPGRPESPRMAVGA